MPLLFCAEEDLARARAEDEDLAVAQLGGVEDRVGGGRVGGEQRAARCGRAVPGGGGGGRGLRFGEGGLQVGDGCGRGSGRPVCGFDFEGPEVQDQAGPETRGVLVSVSQRKCVREGGRETYAACPRSLVAHAPTPSFAPTK